MEIRDGKEIVEKLNAAVNSMSREELVKVVKEAVSRADELEHSSTLLATHLKVLCHKNGGSMSYTKEEFEIAAKENQTFEVEYGTKDGKEACYLTLTPREAQKQ